MGEWKRLNVEYSIFKIKNKDETVAETKLDLHALVLIRDIFIYHICSLLIITRCGSRFCVMSCIGIKYVTNIAILPCILDKNWSLPEQMFCTKHFCKHWDADLLCNFASLQECVEVGDGKTEDLGAGGLLLAHLQHPGGHLTPHPRPQIGLEAVIAFRGLGLRAQTVADLALEQRPQNTLTAE